MAWTFGSANEVIYLRAELEKERQRMDRLVATIVTLKQDHYIEPPPVVAALPDDPLPVEVMDVAPSIEVVIEEFAELSPRPEEVRRQLMRFAALKNTQGKTDQEIVALIRKGGDGADDVGDEEEFI